MVNEMGRLASAPELPEEPMSLLHVSYGVGSYLLTTDLGATFLLPDHVSSNKLTAVPGL